MCSSLAEPDSGGFSKNRGLSIINRRQIKSFPVQQFFKNAAEVRASSPTFAGAKKLHNEMQQKSKRELEERKLL